MSAFCVDTAYVVESIMGMRNLLKYEGIAGACTVLCDAEMRPVQIWFEPFSETSCNLMPGETTSAIVRKIVSHQGGTFLDGETANNSSLATSEI